MIINIRSSIGNGNTRLENNISSKIKLDVINLIDDIYNPNVLKLMSKYNFDTFEIDGNKYNITPTQIYKLFNNELIKINQEELNKQIESYTGKNVLILGNLRHMNINVDNGFIIKIDDEKDYTENNINLLNIINDNYIDIKELINSDISPYKKELIMRVKYNVTESFLSPYCYWKNKAGYIEKSANDLNYKYATSIEIISDIEKLLMV